MFSREPSLLRTLVPFKFFASGPVSDIARRVFERYPHTFEMLLERLEEVDTEPYPKMLFAEAMQALATGRAPQRDLRAMFQTAEVELRREVGGSYDADRVAFDAGYKLNVTQLMVGAGWWHRMLQVSHQPWLEAEAFTHLVYSSDVRRDETFSQLTRLMLETEGRTRINDDINQLYHDLFILERDLYGEFRFDKRSDYVFFIQSIKMSEVGRNDESAACILSDEIPAVKSGGNFDVSLVNIQDRWKQYHVMCKPELEPAPWSEDIDIPEARVEAPSHIKLLSAADIPKALPTMLANPKTAATDRNKKMNAAAPVAPTTTATTTTVIGPATGAGEESVVAGLPAIIGTTTDLALDDDAFRRPADYIHSGKIRIFFDTPIIPRRTTRNDRVFTFELAIIRPEVGFLPRPVGRFWGI